MHGDPGSSLWWIGHIIIVFRSDSMVVEGCRKYRKIGLIEAKTIYEAEEGIVVNT